MKINHCFQIFTMYKLSYRVATSVMLFTVISQFKECEISISPEEFLQLFVPREDYKR